MSESIIKYWNWLKIAIVIYSVIGIVLYFIQDKFLFHPQKIDNNAIFKFNTKFEEINVPFSEKDTINLVKFLSDISPRKGIVVYYHGNMKNITHYAEFVKPFTKNGYDVWMQDYPGYGKSTGVITEQKLYQQALLIKKMADAEISYASIIVYGKSLGTGIASYVASKTNVHKLILETPYYSVPSMFATYAFIYPTKLMCNYQLPTYQYLQQVTYPIVIFHGTSDGVIPYSNAKKLAQFLKPTDKFITIKNADHHNINSTPQYFSAIDSLLIP